MLNCFLIYQLSNYNTLFTNQKQYNFKHNLIQTVLILFNLDEYIWFYRI
jgi:hypothetical protein